MNKVLTVHAEDLDCVIEPGITRKALNEQLRDSGLFFPIDPGADASLGGMAATRCSGTNAVRYGTMKDNVLALKVVLANGEVIDTARRAKKTAAGYDLTRLMVGSEGTLGIITQLMLRLSGIPEAISGGTCPFPSVEACCNTAIYTIQSGIPVARIELLDALQVRACNLDSRLGLPETPMLFLEFHGTEASVAEQSRALRRDRRGIRWRAVYVDDAAGRAHQIMGSAPPCRTVEFRAAARLADDLHRRVRPFRRPAGGMIVTQQRRPTLNKADCWRQSSGHVGDGDFHLSIMIDMDDTDEVKRAKGLSERLVERSLAMDGTCTGEHGVGQGKMKYLAAEHGAAALAVMASIKRALDPQNIMNPGKIVTLS